MWNLLFPSLLLPLPLFWHINPKTSLIVNDLEKDLYKLLRSTTYPTGRTIIGRVRWHLAFTILYSLKVYTSQVMLLSIKSWLVLCIGASWADAERLWWAASLSVHINYIWLVVLNTIRKQKIVSFIALVSSQLVSTMMRLTCTGVHGSVRFLSKTVTEPCILVRFGF